ncbi:MAG: LD-carboxypeptidase, partial [SAR324 cluster bacterium]|nr:LD-carboxypeptidase [SAR324 cluster bacterium]
MWNPSPLKPGDKVGIIAPSSHQPAGKDTYIQQAVTTLQSWGLEVITQASQARDFYLADKDSERARQFQEIYTNNEIKAIFTTRGGYGAARLIPYLEKMFLEPHARILAGCSDITTLLLYLHKRCDMVVFHGPCVATDQFLTEKNSSLTRDSLYQWLFNPDHTPT